MPYTLYVKTLSGLVLPVEIPHESDMETIRSLVYHSLPEDIQPLHPLQLTLLSEEKEQEQEQELEQDKKQEEKEVACLFIQPHRFELRISPLGDSYTSCRQCGVLHSYDRYRFDVTHQDDTSYHMTGVFYIRMGSDNLCLFPRLPGFVRVLRAADQWNEEERIVVSNCLGQVPLSSFFHIFGEVSPSFSAFLQEQFLEEWETFVHLRHGGCRGETQCYHCNPYPLPQEDEAEQVAEEEDEEEEEEEEDQDEEEDDSYDP